MRPEILLSLLLAVAVAFVSASAQETSDAAVGTPPRNRSSWKDRIAEHGEKRRSRMEHVRKMIEEKKSRGRDMKRRVDEHLGTLRSRGDGAAVRSENEIGGRVERGSRKKEEYRKNIEERSARKREEARERASQKGARMMEDYLKRKEEGGHSPEKLQHMRERAEKWSQQAGGQHPRLQERLAKRREEAQKHRNSEM
mmetsp:Transcript_16237/g.33331  ORF Transcript_16237/g.33331 Transcript_16237/m.33331 type:complete len:197 (-) Transcript_16237:635-1225(-)